MNNKKHCSTTNVGTTIAVVDTYNYKPRASIEIKFTWFVIG